MSTKKPEWTPDNAGREFAARIVSGSKTSANDPKRARHSQYRIHDNQSLISGIRQGNRTLLSKAITLVESNSMRHFTQAQELIKDLMPHSGKSIRIGITGVPGAGKSTFIEAFGLWLIERGHQIAVLAIDPSSSISKGSILGDKTRMEQLARHPKSFIRPSPSGGILGGVARKTRETIILCEAAGYDIILVETIGVGQSEISVRGMVDFFLLMQIAGAGDELQGIKKGVMELADLILINKADGDNIQAAQRARADINQALHYIQPATPGWQTEAMTCSAQNRIGLDEIWTRINAFLDITCNSGQFDQRRQAQTAEWFETMIEETLIRNFLEHETIKSYYPLIHSQVLSGDLPPATAVVKLFDLLD